MNESSFLLMDLGTPLSAHHHHHREDDVHAAMNSSPPGQSLSSTANKGFGLKKKWRRLKRLSPPSPNKEDTCRLILKRGLSASTPQNIITPSNTSQTLATLEECECTVSGGTSLDSRFAVEATFAGGSGTDSENSEDMSSSRSSTVAGAPKLKLWPAVSGYCQDKNRMKNLIANNVASSNGEVCRGKSIAKKHRGQSIDKDNSQSSLESDSRSSNFVFTQGAFSAASNGKQGGRSVNSGGEDSDEAYTSEQLSQDDSTAGSALKDNKVKGDDNHQVHDPLLQSIHAFHSVQEALEEEVRKLGAIGCVPVDSTFMESCELGSSDQLASEKIGQKASCTLETSVVMMTQKVKSLESRLEEAKSVLAMKDTRIAEMEAIVNRCKSSKEESGSASESQQEKLREMELEFEGLFQRKVEAEIEYLALVKATQKLRVAAIDQRKFVFEGKKSLISSNQGHAVEEAENKVALLEIEAEQVEKYFEDIKGTEEILKMQRRVCKISFCFFVQLILLVVLVLWLVVLELYPLSGVVVVVPT